MDSFFGFDISLLTVNSDEGDDAGCGKRSPASRYFKEDESDDEAYDALNDETFGAADKGDWEHIHENLVRLESTVKEDDGASSELDDSLCPALLLDDYELELQLAKFKFCDTNDESGRSSVGAQSISDEFASKLRLDPSIWDSPQKVTQQQQQPQHHPDGFRQTHFVQQNMTSPFPPSTAKPLQPALITGSTFPVLPSGVTPPMKMLSVEDIERNIIQQQQQKLQENRLQKLQLHQVQQQQIQQQQKWFAEQQQQALLRNQRKPAQPTKSREAPTTSKEGGIKTQTSTMVHPTVNIPLGPVVPPPVLTPPQLLAARNALFPSVPVLSHSAHLLNHAGRLPLGMLPPYNLRPGAPFGGPINNLAMHPAFPHAALGSHGLHGLLPGARLMGSVGPQRHPVVPAPFLLQPNQSAMQNNQFNQRLVQEIQQNHPLLTFNRQLQQQLAGPYNANSNGSNNNHQTPQQKHSATQHVYHNHQQQYRNSNGMPKTAHPVEHDEYANMMSKREKQWLIGIQLTQLNSDAPYFSDYYFTVFKERQATLRGGNPESRAYKDNQLNHPFTQPKGHAQLLLMSSMAKNVGMLNITSRERRSSESKPGGGSTDGREAGRTYTPLQFENSLGKLQCGSVTAPRKLIDMDVMGSDEREVNGNGVNLDHSVSQRKVRHVLLLIETLYRIVLALEDLRNPTAIEAAALLREKRERDRQLNPDGGGNRAPLPEVVDSFDDLSGALIGNLSQDTTTSILGVRKGKILLRRALAVLRDHPFRWPLWSMIFVAIPGLHRKDRDDAEGLLFALYTEFERQVQHGTVSDLLRLSGTLGPTVANGDAVMRYVATCKFLLSSVITLISRMETVCCKNPAALGTAEELAAWLAFLLNANRMVRTGSAAQSNGGAPAQSSIRIGPDHNIVRTLRVHFERFDAGTVGTDLLNFITDNGNSDSQSWTARNEKKAVR